MRKNLTLRISFCRILDPIVFGDYPGSMRQYKVALPKFTKEQSEMLKGSYDFIGLNQYTAKFATYDPSSIDNNDVSVSRKTSTSWNVFGVCKSIGLWTYFITQIDSDDQSFATQVLCWPIHGFKWSLDTLWRPFILWRWTWFVFIDKFQICILQLSAMVLLSGHR